MKKISYIFIKGLLLVIALVFTSGAFAGSFENALETSSSGLKAQKLRMNIITQNIANSDTVSNIPDGDPYRRKTIYFETAKNKKTGAEIVKVKKQSEDMSDFKLIYQPNHPAANAEGYVKYPNVDRSLESIDLKESQRNYEANISAIEITKGMMERTLDLMR